MARFEIKSKDGNSIRYSGKPRYNGSYLKPAFVEFSEISSPTPIAWEVGDYLDYSRTGMRYYLYSIPQPSKKARSGANGGSFTYSNVQLFSATKDLEIALFRDLVSNDNNIHFSTSPDVATFENVEGIARRIQACLDDLYPGKWEIRLAEFSTDEDAELIESISTAKDFALSGGTCLDALSKIYEMWDNLGWIHSYENGKEVITIGYANKRIDANTTDSYLYGKGNGLTAIKKNQTNKDEFATRLYVYGSERNLPARYYNDKEILNAESVDIRNLMLPLDSWGKTDGLPDARKAYLENAEAVAKFGVIPKTHYFDSEDAGADIYPTIERLTIGEIRSVMQSTDEYYPTDRYADGDRADAVLDAINPTDDGVLKRDGKEYDAITYVGLQSVDKKVHVTGGLNNAPIIINHPLFSKVVDTDFSKGKVVADLSQTITIPDRGYTSVSARVEIGDSEEIGYGASYGYADFVATKSDDGQNWVIKLGRVSVDYSKTIYDTHKFPVYGFVTIDANTVGAESGEITIKFGAGSGSVGIKRVLDKTFITYLKQIGFNINTQASLGKGKTISMKTGACAGRNFVISDCLYSPTLDAWLITCKRQQDDTLGMLFPNSSYEIAEGDTFVLLDIAMPELYVSVAQNRLLAEGQKLLSRASKIQSNYEPSIDAKVMVESGRNLREGMFMEISDEDIVDGTTDYILIDSLSIYEDESAIPTYKVTLREKKKVSYKGTPSATSANDTKSVEDETEEQVNVDLSNYVKKNVLAAMWSLDADGNLVTEKQVIVKNNLIISGDTSTGGTGQDVPSGIDEEQLQEYLDKNKYITSDYAYSKEEVNRLIDEVNAGEIDLTNYYTKEETASEIASAITALNLGQYAKASDLATLQTEVDNIESVLGMDEEAEGIINTWNEVKAFLGSIEIEDDLASILEKMNADIAKRALDSDLEALTTRVKAEEDITATYKSWWDDLKDLIVKDGTNNIKINGNLIVAGDTSTGGTGSNPEVAGTLIGINFNGVEYKDATNGILTIPNRYYTTAEVDAKIAGVDISSQLNSILAGYQPLITANSKLDYSLLKNTPTIPSLAGYATEAWVEGKNYLTSHQSIYGLTINNSAGASQVHFNPAQEAKTLTLTKAMVGLGNVDNTADADKSVKYATSAGSATASDVYAWAKKSSLALADVPDLSSKYLPLSGGTITGKGYNILTINRTDNRPTLAFAYNGTLMGYLGMTTAGAPIYVSSMGDASVLVHSGNSTSYNAGGLAHSNGTVGAVVNSSGNATFGASDLAGTTYKLYVDGNTKCKAMSLFDTDSLMNGYLFLVDNCLKIEATKDREGYKPISLNPSGGNVLIGTTTDSGYKLDVNGTARISGAVTMSSTLDVTSHITTSNRVYASYVFLGKNAEGIYLGDDGIYWHTSSNGHASSLLNLTSNSITLRQNTTINGNLVVAGDTSSGSDIRFKDKISDHRIALSDIAEAPLFTFKWNDREDDSVHLGSSAQYWEKVAPWLVKGEDFKTLDYSTLGVAIGISLANKTLNLEERVKILEKENKALKEQIRRIQYGS